MSVQAVFGGIAVVGVGVLMAKLVGVKAHQVVQTPAAPGASVFDQMGAGKILQQFLGACLVGVGQVRGGVGRQVWADVEWQQPE